MLNAGCGIVSNEISVLGGLRAAAQSISYEIPLTLCVLSISLSAIRWDINLSLFPFFSFFFYRKEVEWIE